MAAYSMVRENHVLRGESPQPSTGCCETEEADMSWTWIHIDHIEENLWSLHSTSPLTDKPPRPQPAKQCHFVM